MTKPETPAKFRTLEQISAGGVAFRLENSEPEIAVVSVLPSLRWQLPKGLIDADETERQAAVREVREEAGIETELLEKIETVEYWYFANHPGERVRFHKLVHFYLLEYVAGNVKNHDGEIAESRWVKPAEAIEMLAFKSEKAVVEKAMYLLAKLKK